MWNVESTMKKLFLKSDLDSVPFLEYVSSFFDENCIIQLPPIQRNSVWNVIQVERLWDSILRGFPIGSFLLSERTEGDHSRNILSKEQVISNDSGYFLLDGQQRTRSILMGFKPTDNSRLWIDLNPNLNFDNMEYNDRKFLLRLVSKYQPWGMRDNKPSDKIDEYLEIDFGIKKNCLYGFNATTI